MHRTSMQRVRADWAEQQRSSHLRPELKSRFEKYGWQLAASLYFCNRGNSGSYSPSEAAALCKPCTSSKRGTARAAEDQEGLLHLVLFDLGGGSPPSTRPLAACWQSWLLKLTGDGMGEVTSWSMPLPSLSDFFHCILCLCRPFCGPVE